MDSYLIVEITVLLDPIEVLLPLFLGSVAVRPGYAMLQPKPSKSEYQPSRFSLSSCLFLESKCCKPTLAMISDLKMSAITAMRSKFK